MRGLARNGTTTALVFGSHFPAARELLFAEAERTGREADFVLLGPPPGGTLEATLARSDSPSAAFGALVTLAREESVAETRVAGAAVYTRQP